MFNRLFTNTTGSQESSNGFFDSAGNDIALMLGAIMAITTVNCCVIFCICRCISSKRAARATAEVEVPDRETSFVRIP